MYFVKVDENKRVTEKTIGNYVRKYKIDLH